MYVLFRFVFVIFFFFQAEDGIRDLVRSRGLGDVYKRQKKYISGNWRLIPGSGRYIGNYVFIDDVVNGHILACLLYTSDAADERSSVDLGGRRIIKKKTKYKGDRLPRLSKQK